MEGQIASSWLRVDEEKGDYVMGVKRDVRNADVERL